jgi:hypothetical protein
MTDESINAPSRRRTGPVSRRHGVLARRPHCISPDGVLRNQPWPPIWRILGRSQWPARGGGHGSNNLVRVMQGPIPPRVAA